MLSPKHLKKRSANQTYGPALALGTNMVAGMLVCAFVGMWLDRKLDTGEVCTIIGLFLGLFYGGYEVWKVVQHMQTSDRQTQDTSDI